MKDKINCPINKNFYISPNICVKYCEDSKNCPVIKIESIIKEREGKYGLNKDSKE